MRRTATNAVGLAAMLAVTLPLLAGCVGTSRLLHRSVAAKPPRTHAGAVYVARLSRLQASLAAAEARLPRRPRTPAQLARATALLAGAIGRLAAGLEAIAPPRSVAVLHRRLVAITRVYHGRLVSLARRAGRPADEVAAANALVRATAAASTGFTDTLAQIRAKLAS